LAGKFSGVTVTKHLLNERHFPLLRSLLSPAAKARLAAKYGWHLWVTGTKGGA